MQIKDFYRKILSLKLDFKKTHRGCPKKVAPESGSQSLKAQNLNTGFSEADLIKIYQKIKKNEAYFKKYEDLMPFQDGKIEKLYIGRDYPRIPCVLDFKEWIKKYKIEPTNMIYTCETDFELNYIKSKKSTLIKYDPTTNCGDLHLLNLAKKDYDFFLFSQTIEHLHNPFIAIRKISDHIRIGGYVFTSVPTINIPHMTPVHFAGIYPMGLAVLFESVGLEVLELGMWGNLDYLNFIFTNHSWPDYHQLKKMGNGIIKNEEKNVSQCWCLAKKA